MAITKVQIVSNSADNSHTVVLSITATTGNFLIVQAATHNGGTLSVSDGVNTWADMNAGAWEGTAWYAKNITGGSLTITVTAAGTARAICAHVLEFSGVHHTTNPVFHYANTTPPNITSGATAQAVDTLDYVVGLALWTLASVHTQSVSSQAFTSALSSQTDEGIVLIQGASSSAAVIASHGPIAGLNTEEFTCTLGYGTQNGGGAFCILLAPAPTVSPTSGMFLTMN